MPLAIQNPIPPEAPVADTVTLTDDELETTFTAAPTDVVRDGDAADAVATTATDGDAADAVATRVVTDGDAADQ